MKKLGLLVCAVVVALMVGGNASAQVFIGTGTFQNTDDLTRVQLPDTSVLEFLDLTATDGMNIPDALAAFGAGMGGFRVATLSEMNSLMFAFGFPDISGVSFPLGSSVTFDVTDSLVSPFVNTVGASLTNSSGDFSSAWFDDGLPMDGESAVLTVRPVSNFSTSELFLNGSDFGDGDGGARGSSQGVWLVRGGGGSTVIPVPAALPAGLALMGMMGLRRKNRAA